MRFMFNIGSDFYLILAVIDFFIFGSFSSHCIWQLSFVVSRVASLFLVGVSSCSPKILQMVIRFWQLFSVFLYFGFTRNSFSHI